jgi:hypothetical protein
MLRVVADEGRGEVRGVLDEIVGEGARRMLAAALEAEVDTYLAGPPVSGTSAGIGWWCATGTLSHDPAELDEGDRYMPVLTLGGRGEQVRPELGGKAEARLPGLGWAGSWLAGSWLGGGGAATCGAAATCCGFSRPMPTIACCICHAASMARLAWASPVNHTSTASPPHLISSPPLAYAIASNSAKIASRKPVSSSAPALPRAARTSVRRVNPEMSANARVPSSRRTRWSGASASQLRASLGCTVAGPSPGRGGCWPVRPRSGRSWAHSARLAGGHNSSTMPSYAATTLVLAAGFRRQ